VRLSGKMATRLPAGSAARTTAFPTSVALAVYRIRRGETHPSSMASVRAFG
jgi:hypothetical protein